MHSGFIRSLLSVYKILNTILLLASSIILYLQIANSEDNDQTLIWVSIICLSLRQVPCVQNFRTLIIIKVFN